MPKTMTRTETNDRRLSTQEIGPPTEVEIVIFMTDEMGHLGGLLVRPAAGD